MKLQVFMIGRKGPRVVAVGLVLAAAWLLPACAAKSKLVPPGMLEADKFLYQRGTDLLAKKKWLTAREYFRQIVDNYPQSSFRPDSKLALGDTYLGEGTLEALVFAQNEFKEFLTFLPTHPRADYAQYKLAMTHLKQMPAADRDQTETKLAVVEFAAFLQRYPNSPLLDEVKLRLRESRNRLSLSDYKVGFFYWRAKWYPGAIERFRSVLSNDPEYPFRDAVYFHLADSFMKVGNKAQALPYYDRLTKEFDKSEYLPVAKKQVAAIKAAMDALMKK